MSAFLYYVPMSKIAKGAKPTRDELIAYGLGHVFDDATTARPVHGGPDHMDGVVMSTRDDAGRFKFDAESQTWTEIGDSVWMGWWNDSKPTPDDLARECQLSGEWVRADDGTRWLVPHARQWFEDGGEMLQACSLPRRFVLNDDGEFVLGGVKSRYQSLWDLVIGYEQAMASGEVRDGQVFFRFDGMSDLAVSGLGTNYHVGKHELNVLAIFDEEFRRDIIDTLRDEKTWREWAKKKAVAGQDGGSSSDGHEPSTTDDEPSTDQQPATSEHGSLVGTAEGD